MTTLPSVINGHLNIDSQYFLSNKTPTGRWQSRCLPSSMGQTQFLTGKICANVSLTHSKCDFSAHYRCVIRHPSPTTLLVFGLDGYSTFGFAENQLLYTIRPGDVWLINLADKPLYRFTPAHINNEMVALKYATHRLDQAFTGSESNILSGTRILRLGHQENASNWLDSLLTNCLNSPADRLLAEGQALQLIAKWISPTIPPLAMEHHGVTPEDLNALNSVIEYLVTDLARTSSLTLLSQRANMSHTKLNRCFKKVYGLTVFGWLRRYRLERSKQYLPDLSRSITQIAFQCGFSSASHFAQSFKEYYQCTPIEFRRQLT